MGRKSINGPGTKLSNAERVARWRQRQREDPRKHEEYKKQERERYIKKKEKGVVKSIDQMSTREKRKKRRQWRKHALDYRIRKHLTAIAVERMETPPTSPDEARGQPHMAKQLGRKKVRKDRAKAYRELFRLSVALKKEERLKEKYKKRYQRQVKNREKTDQEIDAVEPHSHDKGKALLLFRIVLQNIKERYDKTKSYRHRRYISSLLCRYKLIRKYKLGQYASRMFGFSQRHLTERRKKVKPVKATRIKRQVKEFLERDDNTRMKADKRASITKKGEKKQIRLLNDDMKHLHEKFNSEGGHRKISYSMFCKLRPFWIRAPSNRDRETCLCKLHENLQFKLEKAHTERMYISKNIEDTVKTITCNNRIDNKECMYRTCDKCREKVVPRNDEIEGGKIVTWNLWKNKRIETTHKVSTRVVKEVETGTLDNLNMEVNTEVARVARHIFNIHHQYKQITYLKDNLTEHEVLIHVDFSENYSCKYEAEIQSVHFGASQRQVSIHTGLAYTKSRNIPFATVSDCLVHNPSGIWGHLKPIFHMLKEVNSGITTVHVLTDGPTTQYRNKTNMYLFSTRIFDLGFHQGTWNFLEAGHGKGAADGIGAVVKRTADRHVLGGQDITCAEDLMKAMENSTIRMFEVTEADITRQADEIPTVIKNVPQTMKIHQVTVNKPGVVRARELSCFCSGHGDCACFGPVETTFDIPDKSLSPDILTEHVTSAGCVEGAENSVVNKQVLRKLTCADESLVGQWVVVNYDDLPYPGIVVGVDEGDLEVKAMSRVGKNRFFWPLLEDQYFYTPEKVVTVLENEPERVTSRHVQLPIKIWELIEKEMNL